MESNEEVWELRDLHAIKMEKYLKYKKRRRDRELAGEDLSTSEDEDGNKKTGYEKTAYMIEFDEKTSFDHSKGYDPKKLDQFYVSNPHFD